MKYILFLLLLTSVSIGQVKYLVSNDSLYLVSVSEKIDKGMELNIQGYSASNYAEVIKHPVMTKYALLIDMTDTRKPFKYLTQDEQSNLQELDKSWLR